MPTGKALSRWEGLRAVCARGGGQRRGAGGYVPSTCSQHPVSGMGLSLALQPRGRT